MSWTEERIERLKAMWTKGATASEIADELGGVSRNAVIGKAHRLGLEARPSPVKPGEEGDHSPQPSATKVTATPKPVEPAAAKAERSVPPHIESAHRPLAAPPAHLGAHDRPMQWPDGHLLHRAALDLSRPEHSKIGLGCLEGFGAPAPFRSP